ncbi:hypothetical protein [Bradyrhizobium sp. CER78]|nr:hypothetical protein [Bradyrhizobium sp. CER78]MDH2380730.1 hypothetical protein [Bradyrhizobium sp. CER78]
MQNAFSVFVDGSAMVGRCIAHVLVGGTMLAATVMVLARVVSSLTVGSP